MSSQFELTVLVSYVKGNQVVNEVIPFRLYQQGTQFKAIPLQEKKEREQAHLPEEMYFEWINHTIIPGKGTKDDHIDILKSIIREMQIQESFR